MPETSTSVFPIPITTNRANAKPRLADAAAARAGAPRAHADPEVAGEPLAPGERGDHDGAEQAADAERGVQPADAGVSGVDEAERDDDQQHLDRARDERLSSRQPDHDAKRRGGDDRAKAREQVVEQRRGAPSTSAGGRSGPAARTAPTRETCRR